MSQNNDAVIERLRAASRAETREFVPHIRQHFRDVTVNGGSDWNLSLYDLAWVLCTDFLTEEERERHVTELLKAQNADGSWGEAEYMPHSALVDTLAVAMALVRLGHPIPNLRKMVRRVDWLFAAAQDYKQHDTVAFELLAPALLKWLEENGVEFKLRAKTRAYVEEVGEKGKRKLHMMAHGPGLFNPRASLSYTAEIAVFMSLSTEQVRLLPRMMLPNGAIGLSPAATAGVIMLLREHNLDVPEGLYAYLEDTYRAYNRQGFPDLYPYSHTQRLWNIVPWLLSGNISRLLQDGETLSLLVEMYQDIYFDEKGRVSWDANNTDLPDLDDTSVGFALYATLIGAGIQGLEPRSSSCFRHFQREDGSFFCYPHELHPSPVGNLHALMALEIASEVFGPEFRDDPENRAYEWNLLNDLAPDGRSLDELCHDKWHASWTYGAQRWLSVRAVHETYPDTLNDLLHLILEREQRGGWGQEEPTLEETAYIVSGLVRLLRRQSPPLEPAMREEIERLLERSRVFMLDEIARPTIRIPHIWISKNLYTPMCQVASAILDALLSLNILEPVPFQ
ncbi:MAG TPA: hypothetical protein ENI95_08000 [Chloroflexi bacterium]|nr:hypothetical protein [Chloroflexota bacterium]